MGAVGTRILTVEDDERIRTAVKLALEDEGWTVDEAGSGEAAIEMFHRSAPDGADDYLTKPFSAEELQLRVKALLKRVKLQTDIPEDKVVPIGLYTFDTENFTLQSPTQLLTLTKKEAMILRTLYKFKNQLIPRDVILNSVWGQDDYFVGRSLDVFITKLRKYLKEDPNIQINNVHGVGFKFECQE